MDIVTRFAPSPTGYLHIGGARTALYSWLYARRHGGEFRLRIEDTDRERSTPEAVQAILDGMAWLGLEADDETVYQTQRFDRYRELIDRLIDEGKAYPCYCSADEIEAMRDRARERGEKPRYDGTWRPMPGKTLPEPPEDVTPVIRFANPLEGAVVIDDLVKGRITVSNDELDDLIIQRSDGTPTYNFCVVVDDMDMGVTHVVRGDDHVNNTPRQINILRALGGEPPAYAHLPMILGADGKRLSKRHGAVGVMAFRERGYLPEALLNYLVRLGWSHGDQEIFSLDEMVELFDFDNVHGNAATFDPDKLDWVNQEHIKRADAAYLADELAWHLARMGLETVDGPALTDVVEVLRERAKTLVEMVEKAAMFYTEVSGYDEKAVRKFFKAPGPELLMQARERLAALPEWTTEALHETVQSIAAEADVGMGRIAQPIRIAVSGGPVSPPIDQTLWLLGRENTLARIDAALRFLAETSEPAQRGG